MNKQANLNELKRLSSSVEERNQINKDLISWTHALPFMDDYMKMNHDAFKLVKAFTITDNLARLVWDSQFIIIYANQNFLSKLGYQLEDVVGCKIIENNGTSKFITKDTIKKSIEVVQKNMKDSEDLIMIEGIDNKWIAKDGTEVPTKWLIGFNDVKHGIGSTQCIFLTTNIE